MLGWFHSHQLCNLCETSRPFFKLLLLIFQYCMFWVFTGMAFSPRMIPAQFHSLLIPGSLVFHCRYYSVNVRVDLGMCQFTAVMPSSTGHAQEQWKQVRCDVLLHWWERNDLDLLWQESAQFSMTIASVKKTNGFNPFTNISFALNGLDYNGVSLLWPSRQNSTLVQWQLVPLFSKAAIVSYRYSQIQHYFVILLLWDKIWMCCLLCKPTKYMCLLIQWCFCG